MCQTELHSNHNYRSVVGGKGLRLSALAGSRDPTRTTQLRNSFVAELDRRFRHLRQLIYKAIVEEDVFGLKPITALQTPGPRAFDFTTSSQKVSAFMEWLDRQVKDGMLTVIDSTQVGESVNGAWSNKYIQDSYGRGVARARQQLRRGGLVIPPLSESGGLAAAFATPIHADRLGLLFTRVYSDLKGITDSMDSLISRVLAQGIADGTGPLTIARQINGVISATGGSLNMTDRLGRFIPAARRARIMARTEIIRAHAEAQLQEYANWGVEGVTMDVELVTAGDDRVCQQCTGLAAGGPYTIEQARGMVPVHGQCRCAWIPNITDELKRGRRG